MGLLSNLAALQAVQLRRAGRLLFGTVPNGGVEEGDERCGAGIKSG